MVDETLLHARAVTAVTDADDGTGYDVVLSCGHVVWCEMRPAARIVCGVCLTAMIEQITGIRELLRQRPSSA